MVVGSGIIHCSQASYISFMITMSSDEGQLPGPSTQVQDTTAPAEPTTSAQNQVALRLVQSMVTESVKSAVAGLGQELLAAVDQRISAHQGPSRPSSIHSPPENGALTPVSSGESIRLPSGGQLPQAATLLSMPIASTAPAGATRLSSIISSMSTEPGPSGCGMTLTPSTPLASLLPPLASSPSSGAVSVGSHSPPIPEKLATKIWKGEFIELHELLPSRLGAPEVTLLDLMSGKEKHKEPKTITTIQQWVVCFNSFVSVMAKRHPERVHELLAYSAVIAKASQDYDGLPWLAYDSHF